MQRGDPRAVTDIFATILGPYRNIVIVLHVINKNVFRKFAENLSKRLRVNLKFTRIYVFYESRFSASNPVKTNGMLEGNHKRECNKKYKRQNCRGNQLKTMNGHLVSWSQLVHWPAIKKAQEKVGLSVGLSFSVFHSLSLSVFLSTQCRGALSLCFLIFLLSFSVSISVSFSI